MIKLIGIEKSFGDVQVLRGFTASLPDVGIVGISGPSGAGKSTLLRIVAGLDKPDSGSIEGVPDRIAMQFEDDRLFPWMNVIDNVTLSGCDVQRATRLIDSLGLGDRTNSRIESLSGGQRRRIALARALAFSAPFRILDEPTARLDSESAGIVMNVIERECAGGITVIATHDDEMLRRCNVVYEIGLNYAE